MPAPSSVSSGRSAATRHRTVWLAAVSAVLAVLLATPATAQVTVTAAWEPNFDTVTAGYRVSVRTSRGGVPLADIDVGTATRVQLPLPPGSVYYVAVRAYSLQGTPGPASGDAIVDLSAPPGAPSALWADVNGPHVSLNWSPPTSGGLPLSYALSVGTAPGASNLLNGMAVGSTERVSGDLPPGTYFARLRATNPIGAGPPSAEVAFQVGGGFRPLPPSALGATWQGTSVRLSWTAPSGSPDELPTHYVVEAGSASGSTNIGSIDVGATTSYLVDVPPGTFYVRVRGVSARGASDPSNEIVLQGRGAPGSPMNLQASGSGNVVTLRWSPPIGGSPAASYVIEAGSASGLNDLGVVDVGNVTTFTTSVPPGTYYVRVRAVNARGSSAPSNQVSVRR